MERLRVRFEQKRGHYLIVEGDPPLSRGECDEFQLRMLLACNVPGLLKLETDEIDGRLSLRYSLTGTRMLSQAIRTSKWSMMEFMGALCRLAEVLDDCRLYALDAERILLEDDRIFVGEDWSDLRFVYLPVPADRDRTLKGVEMLIVRWMMNVTELEGKVVQQLLRLAASPDFKPAALRGFARRYLAGKAGGSGLSGTEGPMIRATAEASPTVESLVNPIGAVGSRTSERHGSADSGWRWFEPPSASAHSLSGMMGEDSEPLEAEAVPAATQGATDSAGRRQVWLICAAIAVTAVAWRWGYAVRPGKGSLFFSVAVTLAAAAGCIWIRFRQRRRPANRNARSRRKESGGETGARNDDPAFREHDRSRVHSSAEVAADERSVFSRVPWEYRDQKADGRKQAASTHSSSPYDAGSHSKSPHSLSQSSHFVPHSSSLHSSRSVPQKSSLNSSPSVPQSSSLQSSPSVPQSSSLQSSPLVPHSSSLHSSPSVPHSSSLHSSPSVPHSSSLHSSPSVPLPSSTHFTPSALSLEEIFEQTGGLSRETDRTVQLDREMKPEVFAHYLEWESKSDSGAFVLDAPSFVIGRSKEAARHVDETPGISRAHVELLRSGEAWTAKDLGSRNGTTLNGVPMVPYESYPLVPEDVLELAAGSRYRFKYGNPRILERKG
ncbi:FHA domain-containing protein [Cohnella sp. CFH 77786]|uniref:DUF6382 domain-containing protein n=1 Tax=Cohnella sp. CFH 77786 TaxID=2662265 RepID=UPI001C60D678|nr:DUF6382 domain-containing protein [Cohnella sp. CFH 77786]MBW5447077.1 FHA domain-containing protein [Cohnella sp. CFH 77786]